MKSISVISTL